MVQLTPKTHDEDSVVQLMFAIVTALREGFALEEQIASAMAEPIVAALRRNYSCEEIYIPAPDKRERNEAIRREFNGRNRDEVCRRHNVSRSQLYEIVKTA